MSPEWVGFCYGIMGGIAVGVTFCQIAVVWMGRRRPVDRPHTHYVGTDAGTTVVTHSHPLPHHTP